MWRRQNRLNIRHLWGVETLEEVDLLTVVNYLKNLLIMLQKNLNYFLVPDFNTIGTIRSTVQNAATCVTTPATVQPTSAVVPPTSLIPVTTPRPVLSSTSATQIISTIQIPTYGNGTSIHGDISIITFAVYLIVRV